MHVPLALAQVRQGVVQVLMQHVPSTQFPDAHWPAPLQDCPFFSLQTLAESHWLAPLQPLGSSALTIGLQSPGPAAWSHELHTAHDGDSQHTPSTQ